ncbi:MAG: hypothetical protein CYPHOPRED_004032, partial [Cyphobasidiales sp. Tagirdzhanova-0007]
ESLIDWQTTAMPQLPGRRTKMKSVSGKKTGKKPLIQRHHGMLAVIIMLGWVVPPLAVVVRFGIGIDFFLNVIFTCMGYFPGHIHNFFLQNIRNNNGRGRTPKWALKAGLVQDDTAYVKSTRQWGQRYDERNAHNVYDDDTQPYEDENGNPITPVNGFIERHGIRPAQPGGGLGDRGNDVVQEDDLLAGLPDEERERRRRDRKNRKKEYGSGLDARDRDMDDSSQRATNSRHNPESLVGDLDDPDRAMYVNKNGSSSRARAGRRNNDDDGDYYGSAQEQYRGDPLDSPRFMGLGSKKPSYSSGGRSKKSERYGLAPDHRDLSSGSVNSGGRSGKKDRSTYGNNNPYTSGNGRGDRFGSSTERYGGNDDFDIGENSRSDKRGSNNPYGRTSNDKYDVRDSSRDGRRGNPGSNGDEDFLNHQF